MTSAGRDIGQLSFASSSVTQGTVTIGVAADQVNDQRYLLRSLRSLLGKVQVYKGLVDKVAGVHLNSNAAWQDIKSLYEAIQGQIQTDQMGIELTRSDPCSQESMIPYSIPSHTASSSANIPWTRPEIVDTVLWTCEEVKLMFLRDELASCAMDTSNQLNISRANVNLTSFFGNVGNYHETAPRSFLCVSWSSRITMRIRTFAIRSAETWCIEPSSVADAVDFVAFQYTARAIELLGRFGYPRHLPPPLT